MNAEFNALAHQVAHRLWKHKPVQATYQGIHFYDDRFALFNCEYLAAFADEADDLARQLRRFRDPDLTPSERLERDLLRGALEIAASEVRDMEYHTRSADIYIADIIQGLWVLVLRDNAPVADRGRMVLERLRGVWRVLREGTANLRSGRNVPKVWTEHGIQATEGALRFIETELEDFIESVDDAALAADLREAVPPARKAIRHYLDFLRLDMLASSKGRYGVGKDHYQLLLQKRHGIDLAVADMREWAEQRLEAARAAIEAYATEHGDGRTWQELVREVRRDVPESDDLPDVYRQAFERARAFVADRGIVTVPPAGKTHYGWSPQHFRQFHPLVGVIPAAPFERDPVSFVYVTQMESTRQDEDRVNLVAPHCTASLAERAATHAFPGHLLRALHTSRVAGRLTRAHGAYPVVFGWAAYARELMRDHGFFSGRHEMLFFHRAELIDAVRCVMDVRMHTEELTLDEATNTIQDLLDCENVVAEREARRFTITPCEGFAYLWGREQIRALREELRARGGFDLRRFHDALLGCGTLPFAAVREKMLAGEALPAAEQQQEPMSALVPPAPKPVEAEARPAPRPHRPLTSPIVSFGAADRDEADDDAPRTPRGGAGRGERGAIASNGHHPRAEAAGAAVGAVAGAAGGGGAVARPLIGTPSKAQAPAVAKASGGAPARPAAAAAKGSKGAAAAPARTGAAQRPAAAKTTSKAAARPTAKKAGAKSASKPGTRTVAKPTSGAKTKSGSKGAGKSPAKAAPKKSTATATRHAAAGSRPGKKAGKAAASKPARRSAAATKQAATKAKPSARAASKSGSAKRSAAARPAAKASRTAAASKPASKKPAAAASSRKAAPAKRSAKAVARPAAKAARAASPSKSKGAKSSKGARRR